ncbi:MAG: SpoIIE family protein phosphatase [Deltaproteobacteria bacterium]|nr:SpoIIE family protein phosphatase [Deltaproteobacteria bacterium]
MARTIAIRRSLLTNLILVVLVLGLAILALTFVGNQRAMQQYSRSLIDQTLSRVHVELDGFFDTVTRKLLALRTWGEAGLLDLDDPAELNVRLAGFMQEHPWVSSCMVADDRGREHMLMRDGTGWRNRQTLEPGSPGRFLWWEWSADAPEIVASEEVLEYDPRTRPWYQGAVERAASGPGGTAKMFWTEPYTFFTTQEPGLTAALAFEAPDGRRQVIGLDLLLLDISRFTSKIEVHGGAAFVLADDGRIVGLPHGPQFPDDASILNALLKRPDELGTPVARDLSVALLEGGGYATRTARFDSEGGAWWGELRSYPLGPEGRLLIGVAVPESELLGNVRQRRIWIGLVTAAVLALAVGRTVVLAGRYSRPVEALVGESERMATGDLEPGPPIESRVEEVHRLARSHDKMRAGLKTLLRMEHDLKIARRIQESTWPEQLPELDGFDIAAWSEPADETGGDTYDVIGLRGASIGDKIVLTDGQAGRAVLLLADATGHGIGPALSVVQVRAMLRVGVRISVDLSAIATTMNEQLCADLPDGRFITCWIGLLDSAEHTLRGVSGGQGPLLRYNAAADTFEVRQADTTPFGMFDFGPIEVPPAEKMEPGDIFAVFSDGIYETAGPDDEDFGVDRAQRVIREHRDAPAAEILAAVRDAAEQYGEGRPAADDRTIILIKRV